MTEATSEAALSVQRVRHDLRIRRLSVARTRLVTPSLLCITLTGSELSGFISASFDDHLKLLLPTPGESELVLPIVTPNGLSHPDPARKPIARDYTPRRYDAVAQELDIEFFLHDAGPASDWARNAQVGDSVGIAGPRGSFVVPDAFDWHILIGDESALPAIARRFEALPAQARIIAVIEVNDETAQVALAARARSQVTWLYRNGSAVGADAGAPADATSGAGVNPSQLPPLAQAAAQLTLPDGEGFVWVAAESKVSRAVRTVMVEQHGVDRQRIRASAYWKKGEQGVHETVED